MSYNIPYNVNLLQVVKALNELLAYYFLLQMGMSLLNERK